VAIYRFTVSCIDQHDRLCLQSLHNSIFGCFKRCLERMYDLNVICSIVEVLE